MDTVTWRTDNEHGLVVVWLEIERLTIQRSRKLINYFNLCCDKVKREYFFFLCKQNRVLLHFEVVLEVVVHADFSKVRHFSQNDTMDLTKLISTGIALHSFENKELVGTLLIHNQDFT